jgi:hypothetical protein
MLALERQMKRRKQIYQRVRAIGIKPACCTRGVGHAAVAAACVVEGYVAKPKACAAFRVRAAESSVGIGVAVGG